ncbi:translation initiation factor IF-2 [Synechocystis sp. LKSZ1]|uniref:translation initiation factor IF-2 n=1 Tax=Synechocystis sp. LKSZ1 TaxID=3144951 RepID=UPI00336BBED7
MNNAKIRIYDLSKELHLENKDILDICEKLNIAVKSHSSTISETDAERIKASADKYVTPPPVKRKSLPKPEQKQQILAIHHRQPSPTPPSPPNISTPALVTPPAPPISPQLPTAAQPSFTEPEQRPQKPNEAVAPPRPEAPPAKASTPPKPPEPARSLLAPPARRPSSPTPPASSVNAPIIQRERVAKPERPSAPAVASPPSKGEVKVNRPIVVSLKEGSKGRREEAETSLAPRPTSPDKVKPKLELQRPKPPQVEEEIDDNLPELLEFPLHKKAKAEDSEGEEGVIELTEKQKPKLKRPTPPRPAKRSKWEEEEEEREREKAKVAVKAKRRSQTVEDEEEDLLLDQSNAAQAALVSLSIARPPKPQSLAKTAAPSIASKVKKPTIKTEASTNRGRHDRRERKEVIQRPESITLSGGLTVRELADLLKVPETDIIRNLFQKGIAIQITQTLDEETARMVAEEFDVLVESAEKVAAATKTSEMLDVADLENLVRRPPVVTIMGHVDHGKTTLLDAIRKTKVAQGEAGGITQHIGAYHVDTEHNGKPEQIVFLDTPGHEAFTAMRARGAKVTDIAILVVAADDGVQPQTREAISHARAAEVPLIVAINKIDKPDANPDRIKQELSDLGLLAEEWGGDTIMVPVSALKGENLDALLEMILLVSEVEELSANPNRLAKGTVIEANLDRTRGPVATLLVQNGTLRVGDIIVVGAVFGKIRAMIDDRGNKVEAASPSFAVEVLGLNEVPAAGDEFEVYTNEKEARAIAEQRADSNRQLRLQQAMSSRRVTLSTLSAQAQEGELKELNLILKADVQGSVEAIVGALQQLPQNEVQLRVLLAAPGEITETDVDLAAASGAVILGFNTTLASGSRQTADQEGVDIREYDIIYKLLDDVQGAMEGLLDPEEIESTLGQAEVRAVFPVGRGSVAGCYVQSGKIIRNRNLRVRRGGQVIYEGTIDSLKRMKEDAREVNAGYECGIGVSKFNEWKEGDIIEAYEMTMKRRTLSS